MVPRYVLKLLFSEKISAYLESFRILDFFNVVLTKFKNNQILLNVISHIFLLRAKETH
jgi:hypothetical protein